YYTIEGMKLTPNHVQVELRTVEERGRHFIPHVVEPSFGADRLFYTVLHNAYREKEGRVVMEIPIDLAPIQLGVLPLVSKDGLPEKAKEIHRNLMARGFTCLYDETGSIGRRYVRLDEMGVPIAITVDYETLKDETVTLRDRASWKQVRTKLVGFEDGLRDYLYRGKDFQDLGSPVIQGMEEE
ncbi:glycine--tRNA ligase, partial [bacterium]